jgi:DNA gyrase subunit B
MIWLADTERVIAVLSRRGIEFKEFIQSYYNGEKLPAFRIIAQGQQEVFYEKAEYEKRLGELNGNITQDDLVDEPAILTEEMHEIDKLNDICDKFKIDYQLDMKDFLLKVEKTVSDEAMPTKFELVNGEDRYNIASLADICPGIRQIGGKGTEIKRFKGLGEMNADQLWDTTMNPTKRILLQVRLDDAGEADRLFSILMGNDVEKRRNFIHEHALEVQNLDI